MDNTSAPRWGVDSAGWRWWCGRSRCRSGFGLPSGASSESPEAIPCSTGV
ncbi:hypothetical protein N9U74_03300 [Synechococcus sp. AH-736-M02]|nr:hypothetical protein [Synechococcus sp. AH-736-M02]